MPRKTATQLHASLNAVGAAATSAPVLAFSNSKRPAHRVRAVNARVERAQRNLVELYDIAPENDHSLFTLIDELIADVLADALAEARS